MLCKNHCTNTFKKLHVEVKGLTWQILPVHTTVLSTKFSLNQRRRSRSSRSKQSAVLSSNFPKAVRIRRAHLECPSTPGELRQPFVKCYDERRFEYALGRTQTLNCDSLWWQMLSSCLGFLLLKSILPLVLHVLLLMCITCIFFSVRLLIVYQLCFLAFSV